MIKDISNQTFGRWTVIRLIGRLRGNALWLCRCECGNEQPVIGGALRSGHSKSCGCYNRQVASERWKNRIGPLNPVWKGGRHTNSQGYIHIWCDDDVYRLEHRMVVEKKLGRPLFDDEDVHHKNGIRNDNRYKNLELRVKAKHPAGASVNDLRLWAQEILQRYPEDL